LAESFKRRRRRRSGRNQRYTLERVVHKRRRKKYTLENESCEGDTRPTDPRKEGIMRISRRRNTQIRAGALYGKKLASVRLIVSIQWEMAKEFKETFGDIVKKRE
jgi:hypothetical protein